LLLSLANSFFESLLGKKQTTAQTSAARRPSRAMAYIPHRLHRSRSATSATVINFVVISNPSPKTTQPQ
jgi:hypothetical protein